MNAHAARRPLPARHPVLFLTALTALVALTGCRAIRELGRKQDQDGQTGLTRPGTGPVPGNPLQTIARLEDARTDGEGALQLLGSRGAPETRRRAARALGRLPAPAWGRSVTDSLILRLEDPEPAVRSASAFALGQRGDPAAAPALMERMDDPHPEVRASVVEAASRIPDPGLWEEVLFAMSDQALAVRIEAVVGPHRWAEDEGLTIDVHLVDNALINAARRAGGLDAVGDSTPLTAPDPEIAWRAVFSLQRRSSVLARDLYHECLSGGLDPLTVVFALKGIGRLPAIGQRDREALRSALARPDWRAAYEAAYALGRHPHADSVDALCATATNHRSPHVRRGAFEALGAHGEWRDRRSIAQALERSRVDNSVNVRAAGLVAAARLFGAAQAPDLELRMLERNPVLRAAVAEAAEHLPAESALPLLERLTRDESRFVAVRAVSGLRPHAGPDSREREHVRRLAAGDDNGIRLAAIGVLADDPVPDDLPALEAAWRTSRGDVSIEIAFNALEAAAQIDDERALRLLERGLDHDDPYVVATAARLLREHAPERLPGGGVPPRTYHAELPSPGELLAIGARPIVEISTTRGVMTFELYPEDAPMHVFNFLTLAAEDHYDDLTFHRVVPDFVIQGGDYRGDGNGNTTWRGGALREEFNQRKYLRGSLGMPRNADPESGGSQIFVTHRPTPHLDGRYTLFGRLIEGGRVLDAIEVGDLVLDVRRRN